MKRYLPFIIIGSVLIAGVGGAAVMLRKPAVENPTPGNANAVGSSPTTSPSSNTPSGPVLRGAVPPHAKGPENAPVVVEEFGDFQCPPCGAFHGEFKQVEAEYGSRIRFIFREYPLASAHKHAMEAARAAEAADMQGRFWAMYDMLYDNQPMWSPMPDVKPIFINYARAIGLNVDKFTADMDSPQASSRITFDQERGSSMGVKGTPTLFIDGVEVKASDMTAAAVKTLIGAEFAKKGL
jgi:protein-disulfide isomerase